LHVHSRVQRAYSPPRPEEHPILETTPLYRLDEVRVAEYVAVLRRRRWIVAVVFACAIASAVIWNARTARVYEATVTLLATPTRPDDRPNTRLPSTALFENRTIAQDVIASLRLERFEIGPDEFVGDHVAVDEGPAGLIHVAVRLADPALAAAAANQVAERAVALATRIVTNERDAERKDLERELAEAEKMLHESDEAVGRYQDANKVATRARDAELQRLAAARDGVRAVYSDLEEQYAAERIEAKAAAPRGIVQIVDRATVPSRPVSPRRLWNLAIAAVAGLLTAIAAAFAVDFLQAAAGRRAHGAGDRIASERL
jgi:capsular polysaccharide biosynthesis protein